MTIKNTSVRCFFIRIFYSLNIIRRMFFLENLAQDCLTYHFSKIANVEDKHQNKNNLFYEHKCTLFH